MSAEVKKKEKSTINTFINKPKEVKYSKQVKSDLDITPPLLEFYFSVIQGLKEGKSLVGIASSLGISKQLFSYKILPLKIREIIFKKGYGVWGFNEDKFREFLIVPKEVKLAHRVAPHQEKSTINSFINKPKEVKSFLEGVSYHTNIQKSTKRIRGHGFAFKLKIASIPRWEERVTYLKKNNITYQEIPQGQRIQVKLGSHSFKVWLCKDSIIIYFPETKSYIEKTAYLSELQAIYNLKSILIKLENILQKDLRINGQWNFLPFRGHYSHIQDALAHKYLKEQRKFSVRDKNGKVWLIIDNSFNLEETETIRPTTARDDMDEVIKPYLEDLEEEGITEAHFNDLIENKDKIMLNSQLSTSVRFLINYQKNQAVSMQEYDQNIKSHIQAIKDLSTGVNEWNKNINKLMKLVKKNQ